MFTGSVYCRSLDQWYGDAMTNSGEGDYLPGWDDRKTLASLWQDHCPLPEEGLTERVYDALIAVAKWGYEQRAAE